MPIFRSKYAAVPFTDFLLAGRIDYWDMLHSLMTGPYVANGRIPFPLLCHCLKTVGPCREYSKMGVGCCRMICQQTHGFNETKWWLYFCRMRFLSNYHIEQLCQLSLSNVDIVLAKSDIVYLATCTSEV